jgi:demethoxyubiquinone hydroxylase (CLK1/Coq7/Cat5 family)
MSAVCSKPPNPGAADAGAPALTVLYDGACPLCRREIGLYRGLPATRPLGFIDVSDPALPLPAGTTREQLLARFHVRHADGRLDSGARAFIALWATLPGWRWLARLGDLPGMAPLMESTYRGFLRARPAMQRAAAWLEGKPAVGDAGTVPADLVGDLRSDHAGETGAVAIYRGVLAVCRDGAVRAFAERHQATESRHLQRIESWLPPGRRSRLLGPWRLAGWLTGALPALAGPRAVYATITAVETFVDQHYQQQIDRLADRPEHAALREVLAACQADERHHRDEASESFAAGAGVGFGVGAAAPPGPWLRAWVALVGAGSAAAVAVARRI